MITNNWVTELQWIQRSCHIKTLPPSFWPSQFLCWQKQNNTLNVKSWAKSLLIHLLGWGITRCSGGQAKKKKTTCLHLSQISSYWCVTVHNWKIHFKPNLLISNFIELDDSKGTEWKVALFQPLTCYILITHLGQRWELPRSRFLYSINKELLATHRLFRTYN